MTSIEFSCIIIVLKKELYNKYFNTIKEYYNKDNKEIYYLLDIITKIYKTYPEKLGFSVDEFEVYFKTTNLGLSEKQVQVYEGIFKSLREVDVSEDIAEDLLKALRKQYILTQISIKSWEAHDGKESSVSDLRNLMAELEAPIELEQDLNKQFVSNRLTELVAAQITKRGLRWRVQFLNLSLGSIRKGDFGFLFARPETGKTTFLASEISFMAEQLTDEDGPILWVNNEEQGEKVSLRLIQASLGMTMSDLRLDVDKNEVEYLRKTKGKIRLLDRASVSRHEVERLCEALRPSLVVFDQIDKIKGFDNDREDLRLGAIYIWARELAKRYCPVIGVCQADGTGEGQKYLTMDNVSNAKTSKQAEADWILGIGKTHDPALEDIRYFNISKNKLLTDEDSIAQLRHGRTEVLIEAGIGRYKDLV